MLAQQNSANAPERCTTWLQRPDVWIVTMRYAITAMLSLIGGLSRGIRGLLSSFSHDLFSDLFFHSSAFRFLFLAGGLFELLGNLERRKSSELTCLFGRIKGMMLFARYLSGKKKKGRGWVKVMSDRAESVVQLIPTDRPGLQLWQKIRRPNRYRAWVESRYIQRFSYTYRIVPINREFGSPEEECRNNGMVGDGFLCDVAF